MNKNDSSTIKKMFGDVGLNILAAGAPVIVMQLIVYPYLAKYNSAETYGVLLTVIGIVNMLLGVFGTSLNNVRLMQKKRYEEKNVTGDFNRLLIISAIIAVVSLSAFLFWFPQISVVTRVLLLVFVLLGVIREYFTVSYQLVLNYKKNLIARLIVCAAYLAGMFFVQFTVWWPLVFICGEVAGCIYIFCTTRLHREPLKRTSLFKETKNKFITLIFASVIVSSLLYIDRLLIYPILGADNVAVYTVASFFGKSLGMVVVPLVGVLLSYFAQKSFVMNRRIFLRMNAAALGAGAIFVLFSYYAAPWVTGILYPTLIDAALPYIFIANIAAIINAVAMMAQPSILQYCKTSLQMPIQLTYAISYIGLGIILMYQSGLIGFCYAAVIANTIRLLLYYIIGYIKIK